MRRSHNLALILFFTALTVVMTAIVVVTWERVIRDPFFAWVERKYPGDEYRRTRRDIQQRVEHFAISIAVDVVVVALLLRLVNHKQSALIESEERYRALFEHANDGIGVVTAADYRLTEVNNRFCEILGFDAQAVIGRDVREVIRPGRGHDEPGALAESLGGSAAGEGEFVVENAAGAALHVSVSFNTISTDKERLIILIIRDLSARRRLEGEREQMQQQLYQTAKLASLGELAAGVAHEINNPLNGVINFAQLLKDEGAGRGDFERQMIEGIIEEGERIAAIVRGLLTFARHDDNRRAVVSLPEVVKTSLSLFGRQFEKDGIRVGTDLPRRLAAPLRRCFAPAAGRRQHGQQRTPLAEGEAARRGAGEGVSHRRAPRRARGARRRARRVLRQRRRASGAKTSTASSTRSSRRARDAGGTGSVYPSASASSASHGGTITVESEEGQLHLLRVELPTVVRGAEGCLRSCW